MTVGDWFAETAPDWFGETRAPGARGPAPDVDGDAAEGASEVKLILLADALRALAAEPPLVPVPTGFAELDRLLAGGLRPKRLHVLCGPPGAGKTALVGEITRRLVNSVRHVAPVLLCSTEIEPDEQAARIVAPLIGASADALLRHHADLGRATSLADGWPVALLNLDLDPEIKADPLALIGANVDALTRMTGARPVVIVDYMQDMVTLDPEKRRLGVSSIARRLRQFSRVYNVAMFACSSVSRAHYNGRAKPGRAETGRAETGSDDASEDPRAWLAAAKESGDVEFAAAVLMFLETSGTVDALGESNARIIVAKARMGRVGFVGLRFDGARGSFSESAAALAAMGTAARDHDVDEKVLAAIRATRDGPKSWRELRPGTKVGARPADLALARLKARKLVAVRVVSDRTSKPKCTRKWVVLPDWMSDRLPIGMEDVNPVSAVSDTSGHIGTRPVDGAAVDPVSVPLGGTRGHAPVNTDPASASDVDEEHRFHANFRPKGTHHEPRTRHDPD